jgi:hypothetical protein
MGALTPLLSAGRTAAGDAVTTAVGGSLAMVSMSWAWARNAVERTGRLVDTTEVVLDELLVTLREVRPLLQRIDATVETGVLDDLGRMAGRLDEIMTMLEKLAREAEAKLPALESLASTQADVEGARVATERLVSLVDATLTQLDSLPGASLVRRRISRVQSEE